MYNHSDDLEWGVMCIVLCMAWVVSRARGVWADWSVWNSVLGQTGVSGVWEILCGCIDSGGV